MATAGSIVVSLLMNTGQFETDTKRAESIAKKRADAIDKAFSEMGKKIGLAATAAGGAIAAMVVSTANAAKEISNLANLSGAGTEEFQRFAAGAKSVGIEQDKLGDIFKDFREKVGEFVQTGGGGMKDFFEQIAPKVGITADAFRNLSGPQALQLYVDTLEKAGLSQEQMSFYLESMASDTTALIPLLRDGGKQMKELGDQADKTGQVMSDSTIASALELKKQTDQLNAQLSGLRNNISSAVIPTLIALSGELNSTASATSGAKNSFDDLGRVIDGIATFGAGVVYVFKLVAIELGGTLAKMEALATFNFRGALAVDEAIAEDVHAAAKSFDRLTQSIKNARSAASGGAYVDPRLLGSTPASETVGNPLFNKGTSRAWAPPGKPTTTKLPRTSSSRASTAKEEAPFIGPMPNVDMMEKYLELEREAVSLRRSLMTDGEIRNEQEAKYFELLGEGLITQEEFNRAMGDLAPKAIDAMTEMDEFAKSAAQNMQSAFADFLFNPFQDGLGGMLKGFGQTMQRMIAEAASAQLMKAMFGDMGKTGSIGGWAGQALGLAGAFMGGGASAAASGAVGAAAGASSYAASASELTKSAFSFGGFRASGGSVATGHAYMVGERGPEMFVPSSAGAILPTGTQAGGQRSEYNINVTVPAGSSQETRRAAAAGAREALGFINQAGRYA